MAKLVVASAQQQMRLFDSPDGYRKELTRFLNMAHAKGAELLVFPALAGVMAASHKVEGFRMNLLKQADDRQRGRSSVFARTRSARPAARPRYWAPAFAKVSPVFCKLMQRRWPSHTTRSSVSWRRRMKSPSWPVAPICPMLRVSFVIV